MATMYDEKDPFGQNLTDRKEPVASSSNAENIIRNWNPDEVVRQEQKAAVLGAADAKGTRSDEIEKFHLKNSQADGDDFYKEVKDSGPSALRGSAFVKRNKGKLTLTVAAITLIGGGGIGLFGLLAGPLQFVQIAKMLQNFHFSNQEDVGDDRFMKIARYVRFQGDERTRLGALGNAYANKLEERMNRAGITSQYDRGTLNTRFDGYTIDPNNIPADSELAELKNINLNDEEALAAVKSRISVRFNVPPENIGIGTGELAGKITVNAEGLGYFESKKFIATALEEAGYSKIGSAIRARIMGKRAGLDWHPIKKLDKKILDSLDEKLAEWKKNRNAEIENGVKEPETISAGDESEQADTNGDGKPDTEVTHVDSATGETTTSSQVAGDAQDAAKAGAAAGDAEGAVSAVGESKLFKGAAGITAVIALTCAVRAIANHIDEIKQSNVVLPLMRLGGDAISVGNEIITNGNVEPKELGVLSKQLYDQKTKTSWKSAQSIQAEEGEDQTGPPILEEAKVDPNHNVVSDFLGKFPGLDAVCNVADSVVGQVFSFAIDVVGGPISAIVGATVGQAFGPAIISGITRWIAGHPISLEVAGANYGNYINYGAKLASNDAIIAGGGVKLSGKEAYELKQYQLQDQKEQLQSESFAQRLLDPTDTNSLVGNFMSEQAPDPVQNIARVASILPKTAASIFKLPSFLLPAKVKAQTDTTYDYGFDTYGYSVSDINSELTKDPFDNASKVADLLASSSGQLYIDEAKACFGVIVSKDGTVKSGDKVPAYADIPDDCPTGPAGGNSTDWQRFRFFIFDSQSMEAYSCFEDGANNSCAEFDLQDGTSGTTAASGTTDIALNLVVSDDTSSIPCAAGQDYGVQDGYKNGALVKIRTCHINSSVVNSQISGQVDALYKAATADGINLVGGGFRTLQDQINTYHSWCSSDGITPSSPPFPKAPGVTIRCPGGGSPGYSNHQMGFALDFECDGDLIPRHVKSGQNKCFDWLRKNAGTFGLKEFGLGKDPDSESYEAWHWSVDGN